MDVTNHYPILCKIDKRKSNFSKNHSDVYFRNKLKFIPEIFCEDLKNNLNFFFFNLPLLTKDNFNENFEKFTNIVSSTIDKHAPLTKLSRRQLKLYSKPWLTKGIINSIKNKRKMFKSQYILGAEREKSYFEKYINVLTKIKTISKKRYYETKLEEIKSDLRQIWNTIRSVLPTNRKNVTATSPCLLKINDCSVSAPHDIANYLNDFFSTIGSKLAERIDNSSKRDYFSYLTSRISSSIFLDIPSMTEINNAISSLNINKSYGHDQISPYFLRIASHVVTPFLHLFVQFSFTNGIFPKNCTIAKIIPIFKKGDRQSPTNYRPISILTCFSKIFEKLIHTRLTKFWTKHKVLTTTQYGFRSKLSTTHALLDVITFFFESINADLQKISEWFKNNFKLTN